jgi:hypothetical protein
MLVNAPTRTIQVSCSQMLSLNPLDAMIGAEDQIIVIGPIDVVKHLDSQGGGCTKM